MSDRIDFTYFEHVKSKPEGRTGTWSQIVQFVLAKPRSVENVPIRPTPPPADAPPEVTSTYAAHVKALEKDVRTIKQRGALWSPAVFDYGPTSSRRARKEDVLSVSMIVVDLDGASDEEIDAMKERLDPFDSCGATSFSHSLWTKDGKACWRFVVRPSRSILPEEWAQFWDAFQALYCEGLNDKQTRDEDRKYFVAQCPSFSLPLWETWRSAGRAAFDVEALLARAISEGVTEKKEEETKAASLGLVSTSTSVPSELKRLIVDAARSVDVPKGTGARHSLRLALAGTLKNAGVAEDAAEDIVLDSDQSDDDVDVRASVGSTYGKDDGEAYTASETLAKILGAAAADRIEIALRRASTHLSTTALSVAIASGRDAVCAPSSIRALYDLSEKDPGAYAAQIGAIGQTHRCAREVKALVDALRKKKIAALRAESDFDVDSNDRPLATPKNTVTALLKERVGDANPFGAGPRFRLNVLRSEILDCAASSAVVEKSAGVYVDDQNIVDVQVDLDVRYDLRVSTIDLWSALGNVASKASFDPISDYLRGLPKWDAFERIDLVARSFSDDDIAPLLLRKWLISCVARGLYPGCKVDSMLVLQGPEGYLKSGLLAAFGGEFFTDSTIDPLDKDGKVAASRVWIHEWAELAAIRGKDGRSIKAFQTSKSDLFRPSYGRAMVDKPRRAVFCGSVNPETFLEDEDGDRRYWIVTVARPINVLAVTAARDLLWAEAVAAYDAGERWYLTPEEDRLRDAANAHHRAENPWTDRIREHLTAIATAHPKGLTMHDLASRWLAIPTENVSRYSRAVGKALRALGFVHAREGIGGRQRIWKIPIPAAIEIQ